VPMIARWPGRIEPGSTSDQAWAFCDFLPTAAELAGARPPENVDGISMLPALLGKQQESHEFLYWELPWGGFAQAVRHDNWKAVRPRAGKPLELYNLEADPGEEDNVADEHPDLVARLEAYMNTAHVESPLWPMPRKE